MSATTGAHVSGGVAGVSTTPIATSGATGPPTCTSGGVAKGAHSGK